MVIENIIKEEVLGFITEMPKRTQTRLERSVEWSDLLERMKNDHDVDNITIIGLNSGQPMIRIEKKGHTPVNILKIKPEWVEFRKFFDWMIKTVEEYLPQYLPQFELKEKRIRKLPPTASIKDKIEMLELVGRKANKEYNSRKHSEAWTYEIHAKYGDYWTELYDQIKDTPEWEKYRKERGIAHDINFGDELA